MINLQCKRCTTANWLCEVHRTNQTRRWFSEGAVEMLEEDHGVEFLKLSEQPPPLLGRYGFAGGNIAKQLLEALQRGRLSLVLVLLWRHLLAEGESCNTKRGKKRGH